MRKNIIFLLLALFVVVNVSAQRNAVLMQRRHANVGKHEASLGIKLGTSLAKMAYSLEEFQKVGQEFNVGPSFGFYLDYHFNNVISIAPEIIYSSNGVHHKDYNYIGNNYKATYKLKLNYVSFRLPLVFKINMSRTVQPYFFVAPDFSYCIGGKLDYMFASPQDQENSTNKNIHVNNTNKNIHVKVTKADIKTWDMSAIVGVGLRFKIRMSHTYLITKIDVGYNYGFANNYGTSVKNIPKEMGARYNRSIDCMLTIGLPLNLFNDRCCIDFDSVYDIWY